MKIKGYDPDQMCACTFLFEGTEAKVREQEKHIYRIAKKFDGLKAGPENGIRGYFLTFMIAYLRDFCLNFHFVAESFETCVPWDKAPSLCRKVQERVHTSCRKYGVTGKVFVSSRLTQVYDTSCTIYIYFGFLYENLEDPVGVYEAVEHDAREEIIECGGSVSHHHGIGKIRKAFSEESISPIGIRMLQAQKKELDPKNIFALGNTIDHPDFPST